MVSPEFDVPRYLVSPESCPRNPAAAIRSLVPTLGREGADRGGTRPASRGRRRDGPIECAIYSPPSAGAVVQQLPAGFLSKLGSLDQKAVAKRWAAAIAPGQEWPKEPIPTRRIRDLVRAHDSGFAVWSTGHNGWLISSEGGGFLTGFC